MSGLRAACAAVTGGALGCALLAAGAASAEPEAPAISPEVAAAMAIERKRADITAAFVQGDYDGADAGLVALLGDPSLPRADRVWALSARVLLLHQAERACDVLPATDAYVAATADDPDTAFDRQRALRRRAEAEVTCANDRRPAEPPPPPPPPPREPPSGRGTLVAGAGALLLEHRGDAPAVSAVSAEASLGYLWPGGLKLDVAIVASLHAAVARPGLRLDLGEPWSGAMVQLRLAGQVMVAAPVDEVRVAGGVVLGPGLLVELLRDFGLLTTLEGSLWARADGVHLGVDGRMGVYYAF